MIKKRVNKINWHGSDLENNRAKAPNISTPGGNGLDGLNDGEIYVCNADEDPAIFIKTNKDKVARVGGNGSDSYSRDQIDDFLGKKLDKVVWDRNLEERVDDNGEEYLFLTKPLITAYGVTMYAGADVQVPSIYEGLPIDGVTIQWVDGKLVSTGGKGTANGIVVNGNTYTPNEDGIITLPNYPSLSGYATEQWVNNTLSGYATSSSLSQLSAKVDNFLEGTDTDGIINKWKELESFLAGQTQTSTLAELLSVKADKATTLAGYGITDAYTKNDISGLLTDYVTKSGAQDITGVKSFINGLNIGDILVKKHSDGVVELDGDLILTGSLTMFAQGSHTASTILDALPIDNTTLSKEGGVLSVIGGVGGGSVDGIILNGTTYSPNEETKLITLPNYPTTLPASDVYSWAKQPNKPSYSFDELSSHPTTLGGYGITDAYTKHEINTTVYSKSECNEFFVNKAGDTMTGTLLISNDSDIYGRSSANSGAAYIIGYRDASISGIVMHDISAANNTKALYIQTNGYDSPNDTGGLAITNDCVTAFGAGDNGSVFRVLNEDDVNLGALFNVAKDGTLTRLGNKIWDAGNDGSGSGLDADLLDGYHETAFLRNWWTDSPGYDCDTHNNRPMISFTYGNNAPFNGGFIDVSTDKYGFYLGTSYSHDAPLYYRRHGTPSDGGMGAWQQLARVTDNVYSATKLQTPRYIFSKPFDGTNNVTGGAKFNIICIETDNNGNDSGRGGEINSYNTHLYLQHDSPNNLICCMGGGNVGIGIAPEHKLDVNGSFMARGIMKCMQIEVSNYSTQYYAAYRTFNTAISGTDPDYEWCWYHSKSEITRGFTLWSYDANGTVYNEVASFSAYGGNRFYVNGNILAAGGITMYSDLRKKNVLNSIIVPLDVMANADLFDYTFKTDEKGKVRAGTSAQYWNRFLPQVTDTDNEGFFTMSYDVLATTCVLSMAKHFQRFLIEDFGRHETEIERLKRENEELKNRVSGLERRAA